MRIRLVAAAVAAAAVGLCPAAVASPVATSDTQYS